jgi:hypothetical protein
MDGMIDALFVAPAIRTPDLTAEVNEFLLRLWTYVDFTIKSCDSPTTYGPSVLKTQAVLVAEAFLCVCARFNDGHHITIELAV